MSKAAGHRRRGKKPAFSDSVQVPAEALVFQLALPGGTYPEQQLPDCPVPLTALTEPQQQQQQQLELRLESWSQLPAVLAWFSSGVLQQQPSAKLSFSPCLPKELRAEVHTHVSSKLSKVCQSVSEGLGEQRYVAVVAKGAVRPASRRMTGEQQDHAMALWLLWKQHSKAQQRQQQQAPATTDPQQQPEGQQPSQQQQQPCDPSVDVCDGLDTLGLEDADVADCSSSEAHCTAGAAGQRQYSRDEVAQMLVEDKLTDELEQLWSGPLGVQQRAVRLLCLAAAAGDLLDVQELLAADPDLVPAAVGDLSAGGALPLHLAAAGGCVDVVQTLLAAGAPVEARDGKGLTALQVAQRSEQCDVEAVLLQAGAVDRQKDSWQNLDMPGGFL